ncbi:hypothetical protein JVT61DRAFT_12322 [Boletus reticuloceps]|uniref:Choline/carnitine acyltransferase domain-containing protein n=1 Tax=Boletus reticuloceps TaxID=495285 RepID=A0A8I3A4Y2_9AGAM|nr:hypothetical protein JVT61DRAFT_12322 [Boletus reticuloceps]
MGSFVRITGPFCYVICVLSNLVHPDWFDVLDDENRPLLTEREVLRNLQAIVHDADKTPITEVRLPALPSECSLPRTARLGLSCAKRFRRTEQTFLIDDAAPAREAVENQRNGSANSNGEDLAALCSNFLCRTYYLREGVQVGTCTNKWYDKLQIIVCADSAAGINFEHTGVNGHTVFVRFAADVFTEGLMLLARSINPSAPTLFHAPLSPHAKSYKPPQTNSGRHRHCPSMEQYDTSSAKLMWTLTSQIRVGIMFTETRLRDLICQNDCQALEFKGYGKNFITSHRFSPDAFVKWHSRPRTLAFMNRVHIRARDDKGVSTRPDRSHPECPARSVEFTKTFFSEASNEEKILALRRACERHVASTKECSQDLGQDSQLSGNLDPLPDDPVPNAATTAQAALPSIFADLGWNLLSTSILSTSNCGNPALRLFGFGPVAADGYGIGYIIKENGISIVASSRHLQTRRYLDTLQSYLLDVRRILVQLYLSANERPASFVDHSGILRDSKMGQPINGSGSDDGASDGYEDMMSQSLFLMSNPII